MQKLILDIGGAAAAYHDEHLRDLPCKTIEADEIWSFVGSKQKNIPADRVGDPNMATCGRGPPSMPTAG